MHRSTPANKPTVKMKEPAGIMMLQNECCLPAKLVGDCEIVIWSVTHIDYVRFKRRLTRYYAVLRPTI